MSLSPTWYGKPITFYPITQQTHSLPVPPLFRPCQRVQEMLDGFPKGSNGRLESYRGRLYTTFICLKVRQYQQQVEMILAVPININSLQKHNLKPGMGF